MSLITPNAIRTLQRKLYAKAKQEQAYRFYALYDKISREDIHSHAWRLVRSNGGSPGVDGISFEAIESGEGIEGYLRELARDLKRHKFRNRKAALCRFPRKDTSMRATGYTNHQGWLAGERRMPRHEEHRKAVCGRTAYTV